MLPPAGCAAETRPRRGSCHDPSTSAIGKSLIQVAAKRCALAPQRSAFPLGRCHRSSSASPRAPDNPALRRKSPWRFTNLPLPACRRWAGEGAVLTLVMRGRQEWPWPLWLHTLRTKRVRDGSASLPARSCRFRHSAGDDATTTGRQAGRGRRAPGWTAPAPPGWVRHRGSRPSRRHRRSGCQARHWRRSY